MLSLILKKYAPWTSNVLLYTLYKVKVVRSIFLNCDVLYTCIHDSLPYDFPRNCKMFLLLPK